MNPNMLPAFYGVCGVLIVGLLIRIWFKNRAASAGAAPPPMKPRKVPAKRPAPQVTSAPVVPAPTASAAAPVVPPVVTPVIVPPSVPVSQAASVPVTPAANSSASTPAPYIPASSSTILRTPATPTWEDRRLLENRGILSRTEENPMPRVLAADVPGVDDSDRTFGSALNPVLASLLPESPERQEAARKELSAAGYYNPHAVENLAALRYSLIMLSLLVFGGLLLIVPTRLEPMVIAGLVIGPILGWALPMLHIRRKAADRIREIGKAMPDLLDMLNMCVSQGLTVPDALKRILRDFRGVYPALSQELGIVIEQARINDLHSALESFGKRINLPEVHSFTSLLIQTERMGTSITDALTTYSDTMRESLKQRADEKGNRATFRLLFPTVLCLMPAVYLFLLGPAVNELSKFFNEGGRNSLDTGATAIQRLNTQRGVTR
jgi:tight adherence protein C